MELTGVYSLDEIARAADVTQAQARFVASGDGFFSAAEAVRAGRTLVARRRAATVVTEAPLFCRAADIATMSPDVHGVPLVVSGSLHIALLAAIVFAIGFRPSAA